MARELTSAVRYFLKTQVLRSDYVIVGELATRRSSLPYEQKLERVHQLCILNGYQVSAECEKIRRHLYTAEDSAGRPASLLLIEAYLPDCIIRTNVPAEQLPIELMRQVELAARSLPGNVNDLQSSRLDWGGDCYLMCLPLDIHFLLMESDGALLAA